MVPMAPVHNGGCRASRDVAGEARLGGWDGPLSYSFTRICSITSERSMAIDHHHTPYLLNLIESILQVVLYLERGAGSKTDN
jgi:hypothetical protein